MLEWIFLGLLGAFAFFTVLSALVFFHELGHYSVARFFNVAVEKFSIGFGKPIVEWTAKSGTKWSISRIPLGGYVKFLGDAGAASNPDQEQLAKLRADMDAEYGEAFADQVFHFKPLYQRALVVLAGPIANFILAAVIFTFVALTFGTRDLPSIAATVSPDTPAARAGMLPGDEVITIDGKDASSFFKLKKIVMLSTGEELDIVVMRGDDEVMLTMVPERVESTDGIGGRMNEGQIGIGLAGPIIYTRYGPIDSVKYGVSEVGNTIATTGRYIGRIFAGKEDGKALGGPGRIAAMTGKVAIDAATADAPLGQRIKGGLLTLLSLGAALSVGLGVANLMPIPVLDGGHLVYYGYEAIAGRPLSERKQELGFKIGFAVLLSLFVILSWNDIGYVQSLFS